MQEADLYFEIVDPKTGMVLEPGEWGEVVVTTLTRKGMPLIRYRTGDISRFVPEPCSCGTVLRTMAKVTGRTQTHVVPPGSLILNRAGIEELFPGRGILGFRPNSNRNGVSKNLIVSSGTLPVSNGTVVPADDRSVMTGELPRTAGNLA